MSLGCTSFNGTGHIDKSKCRAKRIKTSIGRDKMSIQGLGGTYRSRPGICAVPDRSHPSQTYGAVGAPAPKLAEPGWDTLTFDCREAWSICKISRGHRRRRHLMTERGITLVGLFDDKGHREWSSLSAGLRHNWPGHCCESRSVAPFHLAWLKLVSKRIPGRRTNTSL
jgi:hypothetical protein